MKIATIHRNDRNNNWVILFRDTIRETRSTDTADTLGEAEAKAKASGADQIKIHLCEGCA